MIRSLGKKLKIAGRGALIILLAVVLVVGDPIAMDAAAVQFRSEGDTENKGDLYYYTHNGVIFWEGGILHCSADGGAVSGGAVGMLQKQTSLSKEWVPIIVNAASDAGADPIAMASLLFWENRGFPKIDATWGGSDSIGRGPWQIVKGTWPASAGPYASGVINPKISTGVAADLVKSWGGEAGIPIGSIDQDFGRGSNIPSMATVAKNYNAGRYTWRSPAKAGYKQDGRTWMQHNSGAWFGQKQTIIDEYIMAMTYAYYLMGTGQPLPAKGELNNDAFVKKAVENADNIKNFKIGDGANVANKCEGKEVTSGNGDIVATAQGLAWQDKKRSRYGDQKSRAKASYQSVMPNVQGQSTANSVYEGMTAWSDCGLFVSTVMRHSGADPKYFPRGTGSQRAYVRKSDKYTVYENINNTSQLQPGDVFVLDGHTFLHTGDFKGTDGEKYNGYSASWGQRVPMANNTYFSDDRGHYTVARLKAPNPAPTTAGGQ
jgi:hypothetical protein